MSILDPIGILSFYTVQIKILLQKVWRAETDWDEQIPDQLSEEWLRWLTALKNVERVSIPRCYFVNGNSLDSKVQFHLFVDASANAYAAVAYFRIESPGWSHRNFLRILENESSTITSCFNPTYGTSRSNPWLSTCQKYRK